VDDDGGFVNGNLDFISRRSGEFLAFGLKLLQLRVFRLGLFEDGDIGVSVFPER
jgi:hypothetical protein